MADITISDLELAPALADDMVLAVENTKDTYAATLAMLRRQINKTFVEVKDADFNDLTNDGFYQCTGTPTNSPEAGAINWTLQVSAESGVVVQRAFSLDDNFANLYIRRWNGVTWTTWLEEGGGALTGKANVDLDNLSSTGNDKFVTKDTAQEISGVKTFSAVPVMTGTLSETDNSTNIPTTAWVRNHCATTAATTTSTASKDAPAYVIENYKSGDNWYRKWSDGWIEQGGIMTAINGSPTTNLLKSFSNTNYTVQATMIEENTYGYATIRSKTAASFKMYGINFSAQGGNYKMCWFACGY